MLFNGAFNLLMSWCSDQIRPTFVMLPGLQCSTTTSDASPPTRLSPLPGIDPLIFRIRIHPTYATLDARNSFVLLPILRQTFPNFPHISRHNRARRETRTFRPSQPHRSSPHTTLNRSLASRWSRNTASDRQRHSGRHLRERAHAVPCTSAHLAQTVRQEGLH
jgi:hypothetical protein